MDPKTTQLVENCKKGDPAAFGELYDLFADRILRFIRIKIHNQTEAEEVLQEIFIKVWQSINSFDPTRGHFQAWLYAIARNTVNDFFRNLYRKPATTELTAAEDLASEENLQEKISLDEDLVLLKRCLKKLPPQYQQVIELRFIQDLNIQETATALGKNRLTVRVLQYRALRQLRVILKKEQYDF